MIITPNHSTYLALQAAARQRVQAETRRAHDARRNGNLWLAYIRQQLTDKPGP